MAATAARVRSRDLLGARLIGSTYTQRWLVVDAIVKGHKVNQISFYCDPSRPRVELPAVGDRVRWEFMQLPGETEEDLKNDGRIMALIADNARYSRFGSNARRRTPSTPESPTAGATTADFSPATQRT